MFKHSNQTVAAKAAGKGVPAPVRMPVALEAFRA